MKRKQRSGFALLVVIWGLGVISLLVVSFMTTGRLRLQAANNVAGAARASAIVEGATNLTIMRLLRERDSRLNLQGGVSAANPGTAAATAAYDGAPTFCAFADAAVMVSIEDETGKIDLNAAAPNIISALLVGLGENKGRADAVAASIVAFRSVPATGASFQQQPQGNRPYGPKLGLFQTVMELDQVEGVDPPLFRRMAPMFTVHSRSAVVNARAAPPAVFAAMAGMAPEEVDALIQKPFPNSLNRADPRFPSQFAGQIEPGAYAIRVEALLPGGQSSGRETIIDFSGVELTAVAAGVQGGFALKEIRRAPSRYAAELQSALSGGLRPC